MTIDQVRARKAVVGRSLEYESLVDCTIARHYCSVMRLEPMAIAIMMLSEVAAVRERVQSASATVCCAVFFVVAVVVVAVVVVVVVAARNAPERSE